MQPKTLYYALAVALIVIFSIVGICSCVGQEQEPEPTPTYELVLDCSNAAVMHSYGLPTKADVMQWHTHGTWGYMKNGSAVLYQELPGGSASWDNLYQIEPNSAFKR